MRRQRTTHREYAYLHAMLLMNGKSSRRILLVICAGLFGFVVTAWMVGGTLVAPACRTVGPPPTDLPFVATTLDSKSGSKIATWYLPTENATATVVLLHGIRADRRAMLHHTKLLHGSGYAVVMIDMQAHGESPGEHITIGHLESHDVCAAVDFAREQNPGHRIGVIGRSLGGAATLLAEDLNIDAAVLESVYPTVNEAVHNRVAIRMGRLSHLVAPALLCQLRPRLGVSPGELRPIDHVSNIGCPVMIVAGALDEHTTLDETRRIFEAASEPKGLSIFQSAKHVDLLSHNPEQYQRDVLVFLDKHLSD